MRIVCPHTSLAAETRGALPRPTEYVDVSDSDSAYFDLLAGLWAAGQDFCVVEQDIIVRPSTLSSFSACDRNWCAAPYPYLGSEIYAGLGCVCFRAELIRATPDLFTDVAKHDYPGHAPMHWCTLDAAVQRELWKRGYAVCVRHGPVGHLHDTPTHGCVAA